jgi:hypothetical protein
LTVWCAEFDSGTCTNTAKRACGVFCLPASRPRGSACKGTLLTTRHPPPHTLDHRRALGIGLL